jgi:NADPH:quinone reductase-like Zn-dependent oxidoreductase
MTTAAPRTNEDLVARGEIGGRTVQILRSGDVECAYYEPAPLEQGQVRIRTVRSAISPGTEMTLYGRGATNVYLHKRWNDELRLFEPGAPSIDYPAVFGYRAAGEVTESTTPEVRPGDAVYGAWRHTELITMPADRAAAQTLPTGLTWDDGVDIGQMAPICLNAVAHAEGEHLTRPAVVFGAGVVGLITAQAVRATGASRVHVIDRLASRLAIAESLGFEAVDASGSLDVAVALKRDHGSEGIPVAWECTGSTRALHEAIRVVRRRGLVVSVGFYQGEANGLRLGDEFHHNGIRIASAQIGNLHPSETWETLRSRGVALVLAGQLVLGELPRLTLPIERVADAFAALTRPADVLQVALTYEGYA